MSVAGDTHYTASPTSTKFGSPPSKSTSRSREGSPPKISKQYSLDTEYRGPVIPPSTKERKKQRTLVLCFDGTGDQFDDDNSNVVNFFSLLKKGDNKQQLVYYQAGIGTYTIPQIATPFMSKIRKALDMGLGLSLHHHVMGGYEFLMENFRECDRICIFGFSRGAYTARALAGMIEKVGLLPAGNHQQVPFAYKMYMNDTEEGWKQSVLFKKSFSMDVDIEFLGVWDTVDSVGIIPRHVPFTKHNTALKTFRHAISLDEHRVKFKANLWDKVITSDVRGGDFSYTPFRQHRRNWKQWRASRLKKKLEEETSDLKKDARKLEKLKVVEKDKQYEKSERLQDKYTDTSKETDVKEVWFAGCHTDVGGGSVPNETRYALARIPLRWMIRECFAANSGIQFQAKRLHEIGLDPHSLYPHVKPRPPPLPVSSVVIPPEEKKKRKKTPPEDLLCKLCPHLEEMHNTEHVLDEDNERAMDGESQDDDDEDCHEEVDEEHEELHDALSPHYDQLVERWMWWLLELLPHVHLHQKEDGSTMKVVSINVGRARKANNQETHGIKVHRSVKMRMDAEARALGKRYTPRMKFEVEPTWED